jgi:hypothetical protein
MFFNHKNLRLQSNQELGTGFSKLEEIIGNLNNFWRKYLIKLGEFTINLAKIRKKLGEIELNWGRVSSPGLTSI